MNASALLKHKVEILLIAVFGLLVLGIVGWIVASVVKSAKAKQASSAVKTAADGASQQVILGEPPFYEQQYAEDSSAGAPMDASNVPAAAPVVQDNAATGFGSQQVNTLPPSPLVEGLDGKQIGSGVSNSKMSNLLDDDFGFFKGANDEEIPQIQDGAGLPASFVTGQIDERNDRDNLIMPPQVTMQNYKQALTTMSALRPISDGFGGSRKNIGLDTSIRSMLDPTPQRQAAEVIPGMVTDAYVDASKQGTSAFNNGIATASVGNDAW